MQSLKSKIKVKKLVKKFLAFKQSYNFNYKTFETKNNEVYCDNCLLINADGETIPESEKWINVGYKLKNPISKCLSNLFPYEFYFKGKKMFSIESFFQGIKFKDKKSQNLICNYYGLDSNNIKCTTNYNWKETQEIYFRGKKINRDSIEYNNLVSELYISLLQNPLYVGALKQASNKYIIHSIGVEDKTQTVFSRYEFEFMLNALKDFVKLYM